MLMTTQHAYGNAVLYCLGLVQRTAILLILYQYRQQARELFQMVSANQIATTTKAKHLDLQQGYQMKWFF